MEFRQVAHKEDTETSIVIDYTRRMVVVYSNRATVNNRMIRNGFTPTELFYLRGEVEGACYEIPCSDTSKILRAGIFGYGGGNDEVETDDLKGE